MINRVTLVGRLGRDPEVRSTQSGTPVTNFSMATSRRWKDNQGQKHEETEWHRLVAWSRLAQVVGQYLRKGQLVYIEGRLQTREWEDGGGEKRWTTEIVCDRLQMLGSSSERNDSSERRNESGDYGNNGGYSDPSNDYGDRPSTSPANSAESVYEDDIPF